MFTHTHTHSHHEQTPSTAMYTKGQNKWLNCGLRSFFRPFICCVTRIIIYDASMLRPLTKFPSCTARKRGFIFHSLPTVQNWNDILRCFVAAAQIVIVVFERQQGEREKKKISWRCENLCRSNDNE